MVTLHTKKAIQDEFIKLYSQKNYNDITIKELCSQTPVARTTFYSYYRNMDDLKLDIETDLLKGIKELIACFMSKDLSSINMHDFMKLSMQYIRDNWNTVYAFLIIQPNIRFISLWRKKIQEHFKCHYPQKRYNHNYELVLEIVASSAIECYRYWMVNPDKVNEEKLFILVQSIINSMVYDL